VRNQVRELILAGGLHPGNVGKAIVVAKPHAVDACSGLECAPGRKDREKIIAFMAAVREADKQRKAKVLSA
jgi:phosphoribosylanthranilate isomerase